MVKHVLLCKLTEYSVENCKALQAMFLSMQGKTPMALKVESQIDFLRSSRSFDVLLSVDLANRGELDRYQQEPYHCQVVKPYVHSVVEQSVTIDYEF